MVNKMGKDEKLCSLVALKLPFVQLKMSAIVVFYKKYINVVFKNVL